MSQDLATRVISLKSTNDLSERLYHLVALDTANDQSIVLAGADAECIGSLQNKPKAGETAAVAIGETVKVVLGGTVTRGDNIVSDATGRGIARTTQLNVFGKALMSGVAGSVIEVLVGQRRF